MARPKGSRNQRTALMERRLQESGMTPLDYLMSIYRDDNVPREDRIDAAKAAAPYVHSRMPQVNVNANHDATNKEITDYLDAELNGFIKKATRVSSGSSSASGTGSQEESTIDTSGLH